jgi:O-antigen/teichoic acid export membrane protein
VTDKTKYGAWQSIVEAVVAISLNVLLIPLFGYMGSAFALLTSYIVVLTISYFLGNKYYPVPYPLKRIATYFGIALILYFVSLLFTHFQPVVKYFAGIVFIAVFAGFVYLFEKKELKGLFKFNKKR